ncbi:sugar ABC transporter ATP-binding protein [Halanaerobium sp. ST460_2HS_T2]|uniref:sugar ABC transporter ATP-binding protein n=1 Tax=Halanaerobium sp. ST460_2HS_T2 TaxID=2183914 RepID=UPI000DF3FE52|nr:sugar ABC transporter ATP-binding protein [Halanaerobium sp. ST460_2HS_T2]RCW49802.1 ribose transport system ATP-binding protein [Halanaerobium sp. ST460_2HS_T2]
MNYNYLLEMKDISKFFPGVKALDQVNFFLKEGEVIGLLGENGAGKTTLMNILNGVLPADKGYVKIKGEKVKIKNPTEAQKLGIAYIHQELNLIDELSVRENLFLGREVKKKFALIDKNEMNKLSEKALSNLNLNIDPEEKVENLPLAIKQMIEIARALMFEADIIVMDEPTSSLTSEEIEVLFNLIEKLKKENKSIIYISHRMEEIFEITDKVTVLRNGGYVGSKVTEETNHDELVKMMAGTEVEKRFFKEKYSLEEKLFEVKNLNGEKILKDISFDVKKGEILGVAGLMGSGRTELLETIFGIYSPDSGDLRLNNQEYKIKSPKHAINKGIAYIAEDREGKGLFLDFSLLKNIYLTYVH